MKTAISSLLIGLFLVCLMNVNAVNYMYSYNPYTAKLDKTLMLNQSGSNITADHFFGIYDWIVNPLSWYLTFNGTYLNFNETRLNSTIGSFVTVNKTYVDSQDVLFNNSIKAYADAQDIIFNDSMKSYVDAQDLSYNSTMTNYVNQQDTAFNDSLKVYVDNRDVTYNDSIAYYINSQLPTKYNVTGGNIVGGVNVSGNVTTSSLFVGQPIAGKLGSGVVYSSSIDPSYASINISCAGLVCSYPTLKVYLATSDNVVKICDISANTVTLTDNTHNIVYVDNACTVQKTSFSSYIDADMSPGGTADIFNGIAHSGTVEVKKGTTIGNKVEIVTRKLFLQTMHLDVVRGFEFVASAFPAFKIQSGEYVYMRSVVDFSERNTSVNNIEIIAHNGSSSNWQYLVQSGLNLTHCDNNTDLITCSNTNRYRRYFIFGMGFNNTGDTSELHQLAAKDSVNYVSAAACLDTVASPLTYTLPDYYENGAVLLYAYCGRAIDTAWTTNFIDLRTVKATSTATGGIDTSVFVPYLGATSNIDIGTYNLTSSWLLGFLNWSYLVNVPNYVIDWNSTIIGANTSMKGYVDAQDVVFNDSIKSYVDLMDVEFNSSITLYVDAQDVVFNDSMKEYVDARDIAYNNSIASYVDSQDVVYNDSMKEYVDSQVSGVGGGGMNWSFPVNANIIPNVTNTYNLSNKVSYFKFSHQQASYANQFRALGDTNDNTYIQFTEDLFRLYTAAIPYMLVYNNKIEINENRNDVDLAIDTDTTYNVVYIDGGTEDVFINDDGSANVDLRIEGDTDPQLFFTDASADKVGIGTITPNNKLTVNGTANFTSNVTVGTGLIYHNGTHLILRG